MKQLKLVAYALCAVTLISVFLPWLTVSSTIEMSGMFSGGSSSSLSTIGIMTGQGFLGLVVVLATIFMIYKDYKWTFVPGVISAMNGFILLFFTSGKQYSSSSSFSSDYGSQSVGGSAGLYPAFGLYLFFTCSILLLIILLIKEFKPNLFTGASANDGSGATFSQEQLQALLTNQYVMALGILLLMLWQNQKVGSSLSGFTDLLLVLLFFVFIPYFLAKKANFRIVQHLLLSFALVYVVVTLLAFLNISTYRYVIVEVARSFFAITLIAIAYEFAVSKKPDLIPQKVHAFVDKLDLKKISIILVVVVTLACVKEFVSNNMAQSSQQETAKNPEDTTATESNTATEAQPQIQEQAPIETTPDIEATAPVQEQAKQLYVINDPDGYSNMRATPGGKITRKVYQNETFEILEKGTEYAKIKLSDSTTGYMHISRIANAKQ
jgi:hypothetical protein